MFKYDFLGVFLGSDLNWVGLHWERWCTLFGDFTITHLFLETVKSWFFLNLNLIVVKYNFFREQNCQSDQNVIKLYQIATH